MVHLKKLNPCLRLELSKDLGEQIEFNPGSENLWAFELEPELAITTKPSEQTGFSAKC